MNTRFLKSLLFPVVLMVASCGGEKETAREETISETTEEVQINIPFVLVKAYPHNTADYTQGLQFVDGAMYESAGQYGKSRVCKYELETGKLLNEYKMDDKYFGEGLTVMGDKIYIITWQEQTGIVLDKKSFNLLGTFQLQTREGWGLTNDSTYLIYSDGTSNLYFLNPATFTEVKRVEVMDKYGPVTNINELEYINGYVYANQYETELILKIEPNSGKVVGQSDLSRLRLQAGIPANTHMPGQPEVLNGIAYDKENNRLFITGKNWPKILEVKLDN